MHPERFINPLLVTITFLQTGQAFLTSLLADRLFGPTGIIVGFVLNVVVFFVLAEAMPKTYAVLSAERAALLTARPTELLVSFPPLRLISRGLIGLTNVLLPGKGLKEGPFVSEQELLGIVEAAAEDEVIEHEERELIESIIEFGDTVAREVMMPRPDMVIIENDSTVTAALDLAIAHGFSRLPVHAEDGDDIIGLTYMKDLIRAEREGQGDSPGARPRPAGALHPREQTGRPPDARDAGGQVPPRHRRRRIRSDRRPDHAGGLPRGAGRRDRRRVRHRGARRAAAAQRRLPRRRWDPGARSSTSCSTSTSRTRSGTPSADSCSEPSNTCRSRAKRSSTTAGGSRRRRSRGGGSGSCGSVSSRRRGPHRGSRGRRRGAGRPSPVLIPPARFAGHGDLARRQGRPRHRGVEGNRQGDRGRHGGVWCTGDAEQPQAGPARGGRSGDGGGDGRFRRQRRRSRRRRGVCRGDDRDLRRARHPRQQRRHEPLLRRHARSGSCRATTRRSTSTCAGRCSGRSRRGSARSRTTPV